MPGIVLGAFHDLTHSILCEVETGNIASLKIREGKDRASWKELSLTTHWLMWQKLGSVGVWDQEQKSGASLRVS